MAAERDLTLSNAVTSLGHDAEVASHVPKSSLIMNLSIMISYDGVRLI